MIPTLHISDFDYLLPDERIARYPLAERDGSKLLCCKRLSPGRFAISDRHFRDLSDVIPANSLLVCNNTKVVPARLHFVRESGAHIEIFCLEPDTPAEYVSSFACTRSCRWKCIIGNAKRWKGDTLLLYNPERDARVASLGLKASLIQREGQTGIVEFQWDDESAFSRVLELCGTIPIPPYLGRESENIDIERYQTLYALSRGSVAAPTAGLHFTETVLEKLQQKGIEKETVCLHVGAGTFLPVKEDDVSHHTMHREPFVIRKELLIKLKEKGARRLIAVGTTSVRTLESLYYAGVQCIENKTKSSSESKWTLSDIEQWVPYEREYPYSTQEALTALIDYLEARGLEELQLGTRIIIVPGFRFRITDILITNFHQPQSTLLLLVSAFTGGNWQEIYNHALENDYRFLSYGDSSIIY